jgi:hypothetical protein
MPGGAIVDHMAIAQHVQRDDVARKTDARLMLLSYPAKEGIHVGGSGWER